jgi:hypothetical protein
MRAGLECSNFLPNIPMARSGVSFWIVFVLAGILATALGAKLFFAPTLRVYLDLVNYGLTIAGFFVLWYQVRQTRSVAEATRDATQRALDSLSERVTIADLSRMKVKFHRAQDALRAGNLEIALVVLQDLRSEVSQLRSRRGFGIAARQAAITGIISSLRRSLEVVERTLVDPATPMPPRLIATLGEHVATLTEWGEELQFNAVGGVPAYD